MQTFSRKFKVETVRIVPGSPCLANGGALHRRVAGRRIASFSPDKRDGTPSGTWAVGAKTMVRADGPRILFVGLVV